jgi:hypothetical protein
MVCLYYLIWPSTFPSLDSVGCLHLQLREEVALQNGLCFDLIISPSVVSISVIVFFLSHSLYFPENSQGTALMPTLEPLLL